MSEFGDTPMGADVSPVVQLRATLESVLPTLNQRFREAGIQTPEDAIKLKERGAEITATQSRLDTGFAFWGFLRPDFGDFREPTAIISDFEVPNPGNGVGTKIVEAWEKSLVEAGVTHFAASNIKAQNKDGTLNLKALRFWEKQGYKPWGRVSPEGIPYAMVKTILPAGEVT